MNLADFKRWHWVAIGLLVGLAFGGIRYYAGPDSQTYNTVNRTLNSQLEFERGLHNTVTLAGGVERPVITDIVVYPRTAGDDFQPVVFYQAVRTRDPYDPNQPDGPRKAFLYRNLYEATIPYVPRLDAPADAGAKPLTVLDYLAHVKAAGANIGFRYAWWWEPRWNFTICALGGVVVIGGLWPFIVNLLVGAGMGPKPSPERRMDMSRYGKGKSTNAPGPAGPTDADKAQFDELEAALMAKIGDFGANRTGSVDEDEDEHAAKVRKLEGGAPAPAPVAAKTEEKKRYEGVFYPVAKPVGKKK